MTAPLSLIVARARGGVIGRDGDLPWHLPEDQRYFRRLTTGHAVIMGRRTYESVGHPLPKRRNIVVTRQRGAALEGCEVAPGLEEAIALARQTDAEPFVIGGAGVYREALPRTTRLYLTEVHLDVDGDTRFPELQRAEWREVDRREGDRATYLVYDRVGAAPVPHSDRIEPVLVWWLGPLDDAGAWPADALGGRWWGGDAGLDADVRTRFGADHGRAVAGELAAWADTARGAAALVILLDQFSRNLHRGAPDAFAHDARARAVVCDGLERGLDAELHPAARAFFYMPLMHSEDLQDHAECEGRLRALAAAGAPAQRGPLDGFVGAAAKHRAIIERFGRYPHRNAVLGRESTAEERAFLQKPGSSF